MGGSHHRWNADGRGQAQGCRAPGPCAPDQIPVCCLPPRKRVRFAACMRLLTSMLKCAGTWRRISRGYKGPRPCMHWRAFLPFLRWPPLSSVPSSLPGAPLPRSPPATVSDSMGRWSCGLPPGGATAGNQARPRAVSLSRADFNSTPARDLDHLMRIAM